MQHDKDTNQEELFALCLYQEDFEAYSTYLKEHKDVKKQYFISLKQASKEKRWYDVAFHASNAFKVLKSKGASSYDACEALISTFIANTNNYRKN